VIYNTNLVFLRPLLSLLLVFLASNFDLKGQDCGETSGMSFSTQTQINWDVFPEFQLPFQLIYGPNIVDGNISGPLKHGFSHISDNQYLSKIPKNQRALIYYGVAYPDANQPWELARSPWGNDFSTYEKKWKNDYLNLSQISGGGTEIEADIFVYDIERVWRFDFEISQFKNNSIVPNQYKSLSATDFLKAYKSDMKGLYSYAVKSFKSNGNSTANKVSSYSDTPIVNTFDNIQGKTWLDWQNNKIGLNFITTNNEGNVGSDFYKELDYITPSAYYYYDYPHPFAGEYLSYLLFQIEANKAWSDKPIIPFVWLRYSSNSAIIDVPIRPWMAEATAIFPFFSGADGLWLWENPTLKSKETGIYNYFNKGLFRLSMFKDFFEGDYKLVIETSARDYNESKLPIWRGVVKNNEILIAACNPFAVSENEEINIGVSYGNWSTTISLKGYETKLCKYDMSVLSTLEEQKFNVYPNPVNETLNVSLMSIVNGKANVKLIDKNGRFLKEFEVDLVLGENTIELDVADLNIKDFFLQVSFNGQRIIKKIIKV
jgi:hypothetical protein